ncbi:DUF5794 domain-containing protein [Halobaculum litoreum]|uniref:DUF5794 domain-containing protein n=1 Tax=Halobaculum litoreum TaxID=3031998 RepID=A0ABD5XQ25_9EURY|nr:DUF5794 domain-containing protein [Halobaculum sp. DT92]
MSTSAHPIALRLERRVGGATRLLATVMALPLIDGIFPALVIAGAIDDPIGIVETGLLIFGGSATMAVVLAEMEGTPREKALSILLLGAVLIPVAMAEAALAETIQSLLDTDLFHRFAAVVILAIAAKTASAEIGEYLPSPGAIIGLGLLASFQPANPELAFTLDAAMTERLLHAGAAAGVGVGFALSVALGGDHLRDRVDIDRFRFGSAVALGTLALSVSGLLPTEQPVALAVLCVAGLFAYDPSAGVDAVGAGGDDDAPGTAAASAVESPVGGAVTTDGGDAVGHDGAGVADAATGDRDPDAGVAFGSTPTASAAGIDPVDAEGAPSEGDAAGDDDEPSRAPWL